MMIGGKMSDYGAILLTVIIHIESFNRWTMLLITKRITITKRFQSNSVIDA